MTTYQSPTATDIAEGLRSAMLDLTRVWLNPITPAIWGRFSAALAFLHFDDCEALPLFQAAFSEGMQVLIDAARDSARTYDTQTLYKNIGQIAAILRTPTVLEASSIIAGMKADQVTSLMDVMTSYPFVDNAWSPKIGDKGHITSMDHLEKIMQLGIAVADHPLLAGAFAQEYEKLDDENKRTISVRLGFLALHGDLHITDQAFQHVRILLNPMNAMRPIPDGKGLFFQPVTHLAAVLD